MRDIKGLVIHGWDLLRKPTTPLHIVYGLLCAFFVWRFGFLFGSLMMIAFALWEMWNDRNERMRQGSDYRYEGDWDFWESSIGFVIGLFVLAVLHCLNVVTVGW